MTGTTQNGSGRRGNHWRRVRWSLAALLLALPAIAMRFTREVNWGLTDFAVFGALLFGTCGAYELAARATSHRVYRAAIGVALAAVFLLVWAHLAVGLFWALVWDWD